MKHSHPFWLSALAVIAIVAALLLPGTGAAVAAPAADQTQNPACPSVTSARAATAALSGIGENLWQPLANRTEGAGPTGKLAVNPVYFGAYTLDRQGMAGLLSTAPREESLTASEAALTLSLPNPCGEFVSFAVQESPIMEPGLAEKHPDIKTYRGRGVDDPAATIRFDLTPLGFHASVRSPGGAWYLEPYYHLNQSVYASYFGSDLPRDSDDGWVERDADAADLTVDQREHQPNASVTLSGSGFAANATVTITVSDPEADFDSRELTATADELGMFTADFLADPGGNLDTHLIQATDGSAVAYSSYQVGPNAAPSAVTVATGDVLRVYRLALITDPGYATYWGGSANVTSAKVTLMNRVNQLYEDDMSIRMVLVSNNDLLNLDSWAAATGPNGPCGAAACFTQSQVTGCSSTSRARYVIGQIIGASNYDIGHLGLGQPGGGVANLGVIGRSNKAGGCTGIPTPNGDYYAVDYVAHEMGHQFSGNHPFNGNQLNCSGGNRSAANSTEPGSGSSVMAYAGICLTDDLQAHSDPYFSQRSQQEITTYTASDQAAINEVQTVSLRHFGGGNEVQTVTFGPGYAPAATIQPLSLSLNAAPSATSLGGATEDGNTVTIAVSAAHTLQPGDVVTIAGVAVAGYNGTWTVDTVPTSRSFTFTNPTAGLARSGGGTVTLAVPGATQSDTTVTITTAAPHGRSVGDVVTIASVGVAGYNGTFTISAVPTSRSFQYTAATSGLANSGGGTATFYSPFQVRIGGNDSAVIGGSGLAYTAANIQSAINAISGFAGSVTVGTAAATGFTVTYGGASAGLDVPNIELVNLSCGGCFASVEETNHGGANDSFTLNYNGGVSALITNGSNYTAAGIKAAIEAIPGWPSGATVTIANFGGGGSPSANGFQVTFGGTLASTNVPVMLALQDFSAGASGWVGETDKGGAVDNKGGPLTVPTGNTAPVVTVPAQYTIPLQTPFSLTGSATDVDDDTLIYSWEQNDRGGSAGTSLLNNTKTNGPLFAMFPKSGIISTADSLQYNSPGQNHLTTSPTRVFPDLQQILDNNTNADTGACPQGPIAPFANYPVRECFAEFLPTSSYVGFSTTGFNNASPLSLHMRLTARDGDGGVNSADTTLLLASSAGPFLVTAPNTAAPRLSGSAQTVTWNVAGTNAAPVNTTDVKLSLSTDGGYTYPYVLAEATANDGSEIVTLPVVDTTQARVKIEAVGNIFFDLSNANFTISVPSEVWVDAAWTGTTTATEVAPGKFFGYNAFATVQSGVDAVSAGGTVNVAAGAYTEQVAVNKAITLKGANAGVAGTATRVAESVIDANLVSAALAFGADGIVVDGFTIQKGGGNLGAGIHVPASNSGYAIRNNIITDNVMGIYANSDGAATIENNLFDGNNRDGASGGAGIYSEATQGLTIQGNRFVNHTVNNPVIFGATAAGAHQNLLFKNNVLDNSYGPYALSIVNGRFEGNIFHTAGFTGFSLADGSSGVDFINNDFSGNTRGLRIRNDGYGWGAPVNVTAHGNNFANNPTYGLEVMSGAYVGDLNAESNWWGSACGPAAGSPVSANVDYEPWYAQPGGPALISTGTGGSLVIPNGATQAEAQAVLSCAGANQTVVFGGGAFPGGYILNNNGVTISLNGSTVGHGSPAFTVNADDVTIMGPGTLDGLGASDPAVLVNAGADNFTLRDATVTGWKDGVQVAGSVVSFKLFGNYIHDNSRDGLHVDAGAAIDGVVNINGNLFKHNTGAGVNNAGATVNLNAQYNSWGDLAGPTGANGDGTAGSVDASNYTFIEPFMDMIPDTLAAGVGVVEGQSFTAALKVDAAKLYGFTFKFTYDPAYLTLNTTTFTGPWSGKCVSLSATAGEVSYRCQLLDPMPAFDATAGPVATFNFTATGGSGDGPWPTYLNISHLVADTSAAAAGGSKIYVNNAGYGAASAAGRDITDTDDGLVTITGVAQYKGFVDLQGRTTESGAMVSVWNQAARSGATQMAGATSAASGAFTTAYVAPQVMTVGTQYWLHIDRRLFLATTASSATSFANSKFLTTRPTTTVATVVLLGGDATNDGIIDVDDATCVGGGYAAAPVTCGSGPILGTSDVNEDGVVDILDLSLMGGNYSKTSSTWAQ